METARPAVHRYVLDLVAVRPLRANDFAETSRSMPNHAYPRPPTRYYDAAWSARSRRMRIRRQAARRGRRTRHTTDTPHRQQPTGGPTQRQSNPVASSAQADGAGEVCCDCGADVPAGRRRCRIATPPRMLRGSAHTRPLNFSRARPPGTIHPHEPTSGQASPPPNACSGKLATRTPVPATPATRLSSGVSSSRAGPE